MAREKRVAETLFSTENVIIFHVRLSTENSGRVDQLTETARVELPFLEPLSWFCHSLPHEISNVSA